MASMAMKQALRPTPALQCTTVGPQPGASKPRTRRMKANTGPKWSGTPGSGHCRYWKCLTMRVSFVRFEQTSKTRIVKWQYVFSSLIVTLTVPYTSEPPDGQYCSHLLCKKKKNARSKYLYLVPPKIRPRKIGVKGTFWEWVVGPMMTVTFK